MVYSIRNFFYRPPMTGLKNRALIFTLLAIAVSMLISPVRTQAGERLLLESYIKSSGQLFLDGSLDQSYQTADDALSIASSATLKPFHGQKHEQIKRRWERISSFLLAGTIAYKANDRQKAHALLKEVVKLSKLRIQSEQRRINNLLIGYFPNPLLEAYKTIAESCESRNSIELYKQIQTAYRLGPSLRRKLLSLSASCYLGLQLENGVSYGRLKFPDANIAPLISSKDHSLLEVVKLLYPSGPAFIDYSVDDAIFAAQVIRQTRYYDVQRTIEVLENTLSQPAPKQPYRDKQILAYSTLANVYGRYLLVNCAEQSLAKCDQYRSNLKILLQQLRTASPFRNASWSKGYAYLSLAQPYNCFTANASREKARSAFRQSIEALDKLPLDQSLNPRSRLIFAFALCFKTKNWDNPPRELSTTIIAIRDTDIDGYNHVHFTIWEPLFQYMATHQINTNYWGAVPVFDLPRSAPFYFISAYLNADFSLPQKFETPTSLIAAGKDPVLRHEIQAVFPRYWAPEILALSVLANHWLAVGDFEMAKTVTESMVELLHLRRAPVWNAVALRYTTELLLDIASYPAAIEIFDYFGSEDRLSLPDYLLKPTGLTRVRARVLSLKGLFEKAVWEYMKLPLINADSILQLTRALELNKEKRVLPSAVQQLVSSLDFISAPRNNSQAGNPSRYHLTLGLAHLFGRSGMVNKIDELEDNRETYEQYYPNHHLRIASLDAALARMYINNDQQQKARKRAGRALKLLGDHTGGVPLVHEFDTAWYKNPSRYIILRATDTLTSTGGLSQKHLQNLFRALQNFRRDLGQRETELTIARVSHKNAERLIRSYERLQRDHRTATDSLLDVRPQASSREFNELRNHAEQLFFKLKGTRSQLQREAPGYLNILRQNVVDLSDIQSQLDADEFAIFTQVVNETFFVLQITDDSAKLQLTRLHSDKLGTMVQDVRHFVTKKCKKSSGACVSEKARKLAQMIFGKMNLNEFKRVIIFPDSALASLPFAALPIDGKYLLERVAHIIAPSPSAFYFGRASYVANKNDITTFFALADPFFDAGQTLAGRTTIGVDAIFRSGRVISPVNLSDLPRLPATYAEATGVAKAFNVNDTLVIKGSEARERTVRSGSLSQFDVLLFATHGLMANQLVGQDEAGLALTPPRLISDTLDDGYLSASEVASLRLDANLVILSACNTARDTIGIGHGLSQLSRSFMYAGARSLLATHWEVESKFTSDLIRSTVQIHREDNKRIAEALRLAILTEIKKSPSLYSDPNRWAPYLVISAD